MNTKFDKIMELYTKVYGEEAAEAMKSSKVRIMVMSDDNEVLHSATTTLGYIADHVSSPVRINGGYYEVDIKASWAMGPSGEVLVLRSTRVNDLTDFFLEPATGHEG